jgi:hypothetical protein
LTGGARDRLIWLALRAGLPDVAEETVQLFSATLRPELAGLYAVEIHNSRGEFRDARERLITVKARTNRSSRIYPIVLGELEARITRSRRQPPAKPLLDRFEEASQQLRPGRL